MDDLLRSGGILNPIKRIGRGMSSYKASKSHGIERAGLEVAEALDMPLWMAVTQTTYAGRERLDRMLRITGSGSVWVASPWGTALTDVEYDPGSRLTPIRPVTPDEEQWTVAACMLIGSSAVTGHPSSIIIRTVDPEDASRQLAWVWQTDGPRLYGVPDNQEVLVPEPRCDVPVLLPPVDCTTRRVLTPHIGVV